MCDLVRFGVTSMGLMQLVLCQLPTCGAHHLHTSAHHDHVVLVHVQSLGVCVTVRVDLVQQQVLLSLHAVHQLRHDVLHRGGRGRPARAFVCVIEMVVMCEEIINYW